MKVDRTKFTAQYENGVVRSMWVTVEIAVDAGMGDTAEGALDLSKKITDEWYKKQNVIQGEYAPAPPHELPVINKAEERLGILIENAENMKQLMQFQNDISTPYLADLFSTKLAQLQQSINNGPY